MGRLTTASEVKYTQGQQRTDELNSLRELIGIHAIDYNSDKVQRSALADGIPNEIIKLLNIEKDIKKK